MSMTRRQQSFPQFVMIHTVKGFSVVDETEVDVFLKFPCFLCDPVNVGNLMSGSSTFSKPSLDIWKFLICIILKPSMQDFNMTLLVWVLAPLLSYVCLFVTPWIATH